MGPSALHSDKRDSVPHKKEYDPTRYRRVNAKRYKGGSAAQQYLVARKNIVPNWLDLSLEVAPRARRSRIAYWLEGVDLRQLNKDARRFLADTCDLRDGESLIVVNQKRNHVVVVLRQHGLVFHSSKPTGKLSVELSASLLTKELFDEGS